MDTIHHLLYHIKSKLAVGDSWTLHKQCTGNHSLMACLLESGCFSKTMLKVLDNCHLCLCITWLLDIVTPDRKYIMPCLSDLWIPNDTFFTLWQDQFMWPYQGNLDMRHIKNGMLHSWHASATPRENCTNHWATGMQIWTLTGPSGITQGQVSSLNDTTQVVRHVPL